MFVAASTRCFSDKPFAEACYLLEELEYDKVEIWFDEAGDHLKPSEVVKDIDSFYSRFRDSTRLAPTSFCIESDLDIQSFRVLAKLAKQFRLAQITVPSARQGTPFNAEIDRLRELSTLGSQEGILISIRTQTGTLTEDPQTAIELCQAVPGMGLTLDPSYYICGPQRGRGYDQVFPHVFHIELRDTSPTEVQVPVGLGELDYSRLVTQLERVRYNRALCVELLPELMDVETRPIEMRKMRLLLESLL